MGSEIQHAISTKKLLEKGHNVVVVSMASVELFEMQSDEYKASVLPSKIKNRVAIELGAGFASIDMLAQKVK
jgi:transketolase